MSQHTPTPWFASKGVVYEQATGSPLGSDCDYATDVANAERIVACVNACEGVPTDELNGMPERLERYRALTDAYDHERQLYHEQRDELLAALEAVLPLADFEDEEQHEVILAARAAIARVKGGAA